MPLHTRTQKRLWKEAVQRARVLEEMAALAPSTSTQARENVQDTPVVEAFVTPTKKRRLTPTTAAVKTMEHLSPQARDTKRRCIKQEAGARAAKASAPHKSSLKRALVRSFGNDKDSAENSKTSSPLTAISSTTATTTTTTPTTTPREMLQRLCGQHSANASEVSVPIVVGRTAERKQIVAVFGPSKLHADRAVFLIGPPGTGKSSCVDAIAQSHTTVKTVRLNCSTFGNATHMYDALRRELSTCAPVWTLPTQLNASDCSAFLAATRPSMNKSTNANYRCVVVLDELDQLLRVPALQRKTIDQLVRFLVQCVELPHSSLRLVGIMNAVHGHTQLDDLLRPDGFHPTFVMFPSYSYAEISSILEAYVAAAINNDTASTDTIVDPRALEIIARKIAARDGDARRAIRILQQSARSCLHGNASMPKVTLKHALQTWNTTLAPSSSSAMTQMEQLPRVSKLVLALIARLTTTERELTSLDAVQDELQQLQARSDLPWIPRMSGSDLEQQLSSLECYGLIKQRANNARNRRNTRISVVVAISAIYRAFESDPLLSELLGPEPTASLSSDVASQ